jgi:hypothetical protein
MNESFPIPALHLRQEYEQQRALFERQPAIIQRFLENQARLVGDALVSKAHQVRFTLPERVVSQVAQFGQEATITIPAAQRQQMVGGVAEQIHRREVREALLHRLAQLEQSPDQAIATAAGLLRYAAASYLVINLLPSGRSVTYRPDGDEAVPSVPVAGDTPESAITQASDAISEESDTESGRGELQVPYVLAARQFYLPQWVAFDNTDKLLVGSEQEADAHVHSMQRYVEILHRASSLAPYMVASDEYQRKRYGILGQLINQGRALATFKTRQITQEIKERAARQSLNRGLSISMPYFNDQDLAMDQTRFEVIPAGRIMFIPAFVVRAARGEAAKRSQDTRLNASTRKHLLAQLAALEAAFQ